MISARHFTFTFDAKAGNIDGATTALAYIQTLDSGAGFSRTNFETVDMTSVAVTWGDFMASLDLSSRFSKARLSKSDSRVRRRTSNGSGVFYDNVQVVPNPPRLPRVAFESWVGRRLIEPSANAPSLSAPETLRHESTLCTQR